MVRRARPRLTTPTRSSRRSGRSGLASGLEACGLQAADVFLGMGTAASVFALSCAVRRSSSWHIAAHSYAGGLSAQHSCRSFGKLQHFSRMKPPMRMVQRLAGSEPELLGRQPANRSHACVTVLGQQLEETLWSSWLQSGIMRHLGELPFQEFDLSFSATCAQLQEDVADPDLGLEGQLARELRERLRGDLLYLWVIRRYAGDRLPALPTFEGPANKTWAMSSGAPQWRILAGNTVLDVPLDPLSQRGRHVMREAAIAGRGEYRGLFDAYMARELGALSGQPPAEDTPFAPFFRKLKPAVKEALMQVGGASGLPDRNRTEEEAPVAPVSPVMPTKEALQQLALLGSVMENTRVAQADVYLGHVLSGLCLRRFMRRFELLRSAGLLPPMSEAAKLRASLEGSVAGSSPGRTQLYLSAVRFESYMEDVVLSTGEDGDNGVAIFKEALVFSAAMLAAARRHTGSIFGHGLREEIFKPMTRASKASAGLGDAASRTEVCVAFLLDAAGSGELRMVSLGPAEKERLVWDGVLFGALLQDAESMGII